MEDGFQKATTQNLPSVDMFDVLNFFMAHDAYVSAEFRMKKLEKSARPEYGDDAVGYVQVKNTATGSTVRGKIIPEHRISKGSYPVYVELDCSGTVKKAECEGCKAQQGGCKHVVAFLFWLHRRSCDKATTEVKCYWTRPKLAEVPSMKPLKVKEMFGERSAQKRGSMAGPKPSFLRAVLNEVNGPRSVLTDIHTRSRDLRRLCIGDLVKECPSGSDPVAHMAYHLTDDDIRAAEVETREQAESPLWFHLRAGRLTASRIYDVSRCKSPAGSLLEMILGATCFTGTEAMQRGKLLEHEVLRAVETHLGIKIRSCGLMIDRSNPVLAASPDGLCDIDGEATVVEVKCPTEKTIDAYLDNTGTTARKVRAQLNLQMKVLGIKRGLLCVADPRFEETKKVHLVHTRYEAPFIDDVVSSAMLFWKSYVLPVIVASEHGHVSVPPAQAAARSASKAAARPVPQPTGHPPAAARPVLQPAGPAAAGARPTSLAAARLVLQPAGQAAAGDRPTPRAAARPVLQPAGPAAAGARPTSLAAARQVLQPAGQAAATSARSVVIGRPLPASTTVGRLPPAGVPVIVRTPNSKVRVLKFVSNTSLSNGE